MLATINVLTTTPQNTTPTITWSNPADIVYGTPLSSTQLDATATDPQLKIQLMEHLSILQQPELY